MDETKLLDESLNYLDKIGQNPCKLKTINIFKSMAVSLVHIVTGTLVFMETFLNWKGVETFGNAAESFPVLYQVILKVIIFTTLRPKFKNLIRNMKSFWNTDKYGSKFQKEVQLPLNVLNKIFGIYQWVLGTTLVTYFLKPLIMRDRLYPEACYSVCDIQNNLCYLSGCAWQAFSMSLIYIVILGCDGLVFYLLTRVFCELKLIIYGLENLDVIVDRNIEDVDVITELHRIVYHHNFILSFIKDLNNIYSLLLLNLFWTSLTSICVGIYLMTIEGFPPSLSLMSRYIPYVMTFHLQLLCYCLGGEMITHQTERVFHAAYNSGWFLKRQPKFSKSILLIMLRTNMPEIITVGGVWDLNIRTFTSVVKASFSMLAAMQALYKD